MNSKKLNTKLKEKFIIFANNTYKKGVPNLPIHRLAHLVHNSNIFSLVYNSRLQMLDHFVVVLWLYDIL